MKNDMMRATIFLPGDSGLPEMEERHVESLRRGLPGIDWTWCRSRDEFRRELPGSAIALVWLFKSEWLAEAPDLRLVATPAAGKDWIRVEPTPDRKVWFGTFHGELMAETAVGLVLTFCRGVKASLDCQVAEPWARERVAATMRPLRGSRALILGFGHIGKWIGRLLKPFGVTVTGVNRSDLSRPDYFGNNDAVITLAELEKELPRTDHLILALPGGSGTDGVIDAARLGLLPKGAYVYNLGRGNSIVMDDLAAVLQSGRIAGAGLDVYDREPLPTDAAIRRRPNVILMPHVSAFAPNYMDLFVNELIGRIAAEF